MGAEFAHPGSGIDGDFMAQGRAGTSRTGMVVTRRLSVSLFGKCILAWLLTASFLTGSLWANDPFLAQDARPLLVQNSPPPSGIDFTMPYGEASGSAAMRPEPPGAGGVGVLGRMGHEAGQTVGRRRSATFLDVSPYAFFHETMLFGDARVFMAPNGRAGGSAGLGVRHFFNRVNAIGGFAAYYDVDDHRGGGSFEQLSFAGEVLTEWLDFRTNMYIPFGETERILDVRFEPDSQRFVDNVGQSPAFDPGIGSFIEFQRRTFTASAMEGFDATFTAPIPGSFAERFHLEASAGFYHFQVRGRNIDDVWGWMLRADADIFNGLSHLFLQLTSDNTFKQNVMFGVDINYRHDQELRPRIGKSQFSRMAQFVRRNRHVVAVEDSFLNPPELAINPDTGNPYLVYHVRNVLDPPPPNFPAPTGDGSLSRPFQFIHEGINASPDADIVFVHANSVYDADPLNPDGIDNADAIVELREDVLVLGEGVPLTIPVENLPTPIPLPTVTPTPANRPLITNVVGPAVTLADGSRFAGFDIENVTGTAVLADGIFRSQVDEVRITNTFGPEAHGVSVTDSSGTIIFENVSIEGTEGNALQVLRGTANVLFVGENSILNDSGFSVLIQDAGRAVNLLGTEIVDNGGHGILVEATAPGLSTANVTFGSVDLNGTVPFVDPVDPDRDSPAGIHIRSHSAAVSFLGDILIDGHDGDAFWVQELRPTGGVSVQGTTTINARNAHGILVTDMVEGENPLAPGTNRAGSVVFGGNTTIGVPVGGTDPAVRMQSSSGTVNFIGNLAINGSFASGIEISDIADTGTTAGQFLSAGFISISDTLGPAFNVENVAKSNFRVATAATGGLVIDDRFNIGINFAEFAGTAVFAGPTTVNNQQEVEDVGILMVDNTGDIGFGLTSVNDARGDGSFGVLALNNVNPAANQFSDISFSTLNVTSEEATAAAFLDNDNIAIGGGQIEAIGATGIWVENNRRHDISLSAVTASDSDFGIFVQDSPGRFFVTGIAGSLGAGGTIETMSEAGAFFDNTNVVELNWMEFLANNVGVEGNAMIDRGPFNITPRFIIANSMIDASAMQGILMTNVRTFRLLNSTLLENGGAQAQISAGVRLDEDDNLVEYEFEFDNNTITDALGAPIGGAPMVLIETLPAIGQGAPLDLFFTNHGNPADPTVIERIDANRTGQAALAVNWRGDFNATVVNNVFNLDSGGGQTAVDMQINGLADVLYSNNQVNAAGTGATGVNFRFQQSAAVEISNNIVFDDDGFPIDQSGFFFQGTNSVGIDLTFQAANSNVFITNNLIQFSIPGQATGGNGIIFRRIFGPSNVTIEGNIIELVPPIFGPGFGVPAAQRGIWFQDVRGEISLFGTEDNIITPGAFPPIIFDFVIPPGTSTGSILINGAPRP
jgi:hypothetical protein